MFSEGAMSPGMQVPLGAGKDQDTDSPPDLPGGTQVSELFQTSEPQNLDGTNLCCLNLTTWQRVMATLGNSDFQIAVSGFF